MENVKVPLSKLLLVTYACVLPKIDKACLVVGKQDRALWKGDNFPNDNVGWNESKVANKEKI